MSNTQWLFRLTIAIFLTIIIVGNTFFEASQYYDFVRRCNCGSQEVYYADRTGYIAGEVVVSVLLSAVVIVIILMTHPLVGLVVVSVFFGLAALVKFREGASGGYQAMSDMAAYFAYLQVIGRSRFLIALVCGALTIFTGICMFIMCGGQQPAANKPKV